jgi:hypothetical protein
MLIMDANFMLFLIHRTQLPKATLKMRTVRYHI